MAPSADFSVCLMCGCIGRQVINFNVEGAESGNKNIDNAGNCYIIELYKLNTQFSDAKRVYFFR